MANNADPDQLASSEANWSGSTLFAKTGHDVFSKRRVNFGSSVCNYRDLLLPKYLLGIGNPFTCFLLGVFRFLSLPRLSLDTDWNEKQYEVHNTDKREK